MEQDIINAKAVAHIAALAKLHLTQDQLTRIGPQLSTVLAFMSKIQALDTSGIPETAQVTGLHNVFREDIVDESRTLSQEAALRNARKTHDGYFVVDAVLKEF